MLTTPALSRHHKEAEETADAARRFADFSMKPARLSAAGRRLKGKNIVRAVLMTRAAESLITTGVAAPAPMSPAEIKEAAGERNMRLDTTLRRLKDAGEVTKTAHGKYAYEASQLKAGARRLALCIPDDDDEPP